MADVLDLLFARYDEATARAMLRDSRLRQQVSNDAYEAGVAVPAPIANTDEWENLVVALITLRIKFPQREAMEKVAMNIAMREQRS